MKEAFDKYLTSRGYSKVTPGGHPSTVYDYCRRIDFVAKEEGVSWAGLAERLADILPQYDVGGCKQKLGSRSHNAVICALKRFSDFLSVQKA